MAALRSFLYALLGRASSSSQAQTGSSTPALVPRTSVHTTVHAATQTIHARFCTVQDKPGEKMMYSAIVKKEMSRLFISTDDTKTLDEIFDEISCADAKFPDIHELTIEGDFKPKKLIIISNAFPNLTHLSIGLNLTDSDVSRALQMHFPQLEHLEVNKIDTDNLALFLSQKLKLKTLSYTQRFGSFDNAQARFFENHPTLINIGPDKGTFTLPLSLLKFLTDKHDALDTIETLKLENLTSTDLAILQTIDWLKLPKLKTVIIDQNLNALQHLPDTIKTLHIKSADEIASECAQFTDIHELTIEEDFSADKLIIISNAFPNLTHLSIDLDLTDSDVSRALQMHFPQLEHLEVNKIDTENLELFLSQKLKLKTLSYTQRFGSFDNAQARFFEDHPTLINIGPDKGTFNLPVSLLKFLTDKHARLDTIKTLKLEHIDSKDLDVLQTIDWSRLPNLNTVIIDQNLNALQHLPDTIKTLHIESATTDRPVQLPHNLLDLFPKLTHIIGDIEAPTIVSEQICYQTSDREVYPWSGINDSIIKLQTTAEFLERYAPRDLAKLPHLATLSLHEALCTSATAQKDMEAFLDACPSLTDMILMAPPAFEISSLTKNPLPIITVKEEHF